jgi:diguanylate cyclase (GGDEF)-like protein/PAS domain S-box-containing protein
MRRPAFRIAATMHDFATKDPSPAATPAEVLQGVLFDSRQRWRELVNLAADFAFETDEWGRFTLITPDPALGWSAEALLGQPSVGLLGEGGDAVFDPFRVTARVRHRQAWIKRGDGGWACLTFCAAPIRDSAGVVVGTRGVGIDVTDLDDQVAQAAMALRRSEVIDHILRRTGREALASRMMGLALDAIRDGLGAEGVAVLFAATGAVAARLVAVSGLSAETIVDVANRQLRSGETGPSTIKSADGRAVLVADWQTLSEENAGLVAWRQPNSRGWDADDSLLIGSAAKITRMLVEREAVQLEMSHQARTDPLTGLLNRRAFLEEIERHAARQDQDNLPATLMFADLDNFKPVNDQLGHEAGDEVLRCTAALLRKTFRPGDLVARLGGDEFAIWLNGADHMTAAERAEFLRDAVPHELEDITGPDLPRVGVSIGIATREPGGGEPLNSLMRRADRAMYEVKRGGRGHWRVSLLKRP